MLRNRDDLYSAADYQPITDEHFLRRCSVPVECDLKEDDELYDDDRKLLDGLASWSNYN